MIIEKTEGNINSTDLNGRRHEKIFLDHYDLTKPHQKLKTESGETFAVSLDHGQMLEDGSIIYQDEERVVSIELLPEKCLIIRPEGNIQWARAAFNIGNMHQAAYIHEDCILVAYDAILESVVKKLDVKYDCQVCRLEGIRANVSQEAGHSHSHDHEYNHTHTHSHSHSHRHEHE